MEHESRDLTGGPGFYDKIDGRFRTFSLAGNADFVVRLKPSAKEYVIREMNLEGFDSIGVAGDIAIFRRGRGGIDKDGDLLNTRTGVVAVVPALIDEDGLIRYFVPDEVTVQFHDNVTDEEALGEIERQGSSVIHRHRTAGYFTVSVPDGKGLFEAVNDFVALSSVEFAEPSEIGIDDALHIPSDPGFDQLWAFLNTGQVVNGVKGVSGVDVNAVKAWDLSRGSSSVIMAIVDSGADLGHVDLVSSLLARGSEDWDFTSSAQKEPKDLEGHGTFVAGVAAAAENGVGIVGIAPLCRLMPLRVTLKVGNLSERADAINFVVARASITPGLRYVINCSWRTGGDFLAIRKAIKKAVDHNILVICAAGNAGQDLGKHPVYPAVYSTVMTVAACDQSDRKTDFSNFGNAVDVVAPGVNILTTKLGGSFSFWLGTSLAAPLVAGVAGLIWATDVGLTNMEVRKIIENSCVSLDAANPSFAGKLGKGRIDARKALEFLKSESD